jgi:hypothetical protein
MWHMLEANFVLLELYLRRNFVGGAPDFVELEFLARVPGVLGHLSAKGAPELPELSGAWLELLEFRATSALKVSRNCRNSQAPG